MKRIIVLLAVMLLFVGCSSKEAALDLLGSSDISGQWVAYNEPDVLNQPSDLYLSFAEDGSMYYWDTTEYGYVFTQFEGVYHYAAAENFSDKAIVSVELQTVEGGASKGDPFTVKEELSVELLDQNTLQITVDNMEEHFSVGI